MTSKVVQVWALHTNVVTAKLRDKRFRVAKKKTKCSKNHRYQVAWHTTDFMTNVFYELSKKVLKMI